MFGNGGSGYSGYTSYTQIGALTNWAWVHSSDQHVIALKTDGTLWGWGYGGLGQLGKGVAGSYYSPVQIGTLTNWIIPAPGQSATLFSYPVAGINMTMATHL
jgi:alpha-tubulin suppressor-like RCC1 family protein